MITEVTSFFDNPDLIGKGNKLWQPVDSDLYNVRLWLIKRAIWLSFLKTVTKSVEKQNSLKKYI